MKILWMKRVEGAKASVEELRMIQMINLLMMRQQAIKAILPVKSISRIIMQVNVIIFKSIIYIIFKFINLSGNCLCQTYS